MRAFLLCIMWVLSAVGPLARAEAAPGAEQRIALLIGNANYRAGPILGAPLDDARLLGGELRRAGFAVEIAENLDQQAMRSAIAAFGDKIRPGATILFFFSGYGIQAKGNSYLIPVDAEIWTEADVRRQGISVEQVLDAIGKAGAGVKLVALDASRRNPFERRFRRLSEGLARMAAPADSLIISAAEPDKVIEDDSDGGLFVGELVKEIRAPNLSAKEIFNQVRTGVSGATKGEETPIVISTLAADFFFAPSERVDSAVVAAGLGSEQAGKATAAPASALGPPKGEFKAGAVFRDCGSCPELVVAPAGEFLMGSQDFETEQPVHSVAIGRPFAVGRAEVTDAQWDACVADGGCGGWRPDGHGRSRSDQPASGVSWSDSQTYLRWLSQKTGHAYRLPSEAEWEYVARAGAATAFWWGDEIGSGHANCRGCGAGADGRPTRAGAFAPNAFGLYDVAGNVAEWVQDCWSDSYRGAPSDGSAREDGACKQRVVRGGSFDSGARYLRSAARFLYDAELRYYANGFRVVRDLP